MADVLEHLKHAKLLQAPPASYWTECIPFHLLQVAVRQPIPQACLHYNGQCANRALVPLLLKPSHASAKHRKHHIMCATRTPLLTAQALCNHALGQQLHPQQEHAGAGL
jgi:hypothetical protein